MLLKEILSTDYTPKKLMIQIELVADEHETGLITQRLQQKKIKPTQDNIKLYLMQCLLKPLDELPFPERTIIMRSGQPERFE